MKIVGGLGAVKHEEALNGLVIQETSVRWRPGATRDRSLEVDVDADRETLIELVAPEGTRLLLPHQMWSPYRQGDELDATSLIEEHASPSRGVGEWIIRAVQVLSPNALDGAAGAVVRSAGASAEGVWDGRLGLRRIDDLHASNDPPLLAQTDSVGLPTAGPYLLLLHGTFVSPEMAFGDLADTETWMRIQDAYSDGRVLAFHHRTLTEDPLTNASDLLSRLPVGATLDLLSHSRGGLVGELLRRGPLDAALRAELIKKLADRIDPAESGDRAQQTLIDLNRRFDDFDRLATDRRVVVRRHVRVATPMAGTPLAGERLHRWASALLSLLALLPTSTGSRELFKAARAVLLLLVRRANDVDALPGIACMDPDAGLARLISARPADDRGLSIVVGEHHGSGPLSHLGQFVAGAFFQQSNDLVVPTASMFADVTTLTGRDLRLRGSEATHLGYFRAPAVQRHLAEALELVPTRGQGRPRALRLRARDAGPAPVVFVLPGIMGSELRIPGAVDTTWFNLPRLMLGGIDRVADVGVKVEATVWRRFYGELIDFLERVELPVVPFGYDWRQGFDSLAADLGKRVQEMLADSAAARPPVSFIAHSMGGAVLRHLLATRPELAVELRARGGRAVLLGTPTFGAFAPYLALTGRDEIVRALAWADLVHSKADLVAIFKRFPGLIELARKPDDAPAWGEALKRFELLSADSTAAYWRRREEETIFDLHYVAGLGDDTPAGLVLKGGDIAFVETAEGDGRVPWDRGHADWMKSIHYVRAGHSDLSRHSRAFEGYAELLLTGKTTMLASTPESSRGALRPTAPPRVEAATSAVISDRDLNRIPHDDGSGGAGSSAQAVFSALAVRVVHGGLHTARGPLLLGRFAGDGLRSAERFLDRLYAGLLRERIDLGLQPQECGEFDIVTAPANTTDRRLDVLVLGLGLRGTVDRRRLAVAIGRSVTALRSRAPGPGKTLSALLLGTSASERISVQDSVMALVEGVLRANRRLRSVGRTDDAIETLEIIEHHHDLAREAATTVASMQGALSFALRDGERLDLIRGLQQRDGWRADVGLRRAAWWLHPSVRKRADGMWAFSSGDESASTRAVPVAVHRQDTEWLALEAPTAHDQLIDERFKSITSSAFRRVLARERPVFLRVDDATGSVPWELLRASRDDLPISLSAGMIRQHIRVDATEVLPAPPRRAAVVIADPTLVGEPGYRPLAGARLEGGVVAGLLTAADYRVASRLGGTASDCLTALTDEHRVLHIAAHGDERGVVLGSGRRLDGGFLDTVDTVPVLVVLNCCHLGAQVGEFWRAIPSLARAFLGRGARAFVAAAWPVDDGAALTFAEALYRSMLGGIPFGEAVRRARLSIFRESDGDRTWAAYQCYGDPEFVLDTATLDEGESVRGAPLDTAQDLEAAITTLQGQLRAAAPTERPRLHADLLGMLDQAERFDREGGAERDAVLSAEVRRRAGVALLDLGDWARGTTWLLDVRRPEDAKGSYWMWRYQVESRLRAGRKETNAQVAQLGRSIEALVTMQPDAFGVLGHHWLRMAAAHPNERATYLQRASAVYAAEVARMESGEGEGGRASGVPALTLVEYAVVQWLAGDAASARATLGRVRAPEAGEQRTFEQRGEAMAALAAALVAALDNAEEQLARATDGVRETFRRVFLMRATRLWADVTMEWLDGVVALAAAGAVRNALVEASKTLHQGLG